MRLDKFLKVSRLIKRRSVAKEVADKGRILINGKQAKSSSTVKAGDEMTLQFGNKTVVVRVDKIVETTKKDEAQEMYTLISETVAPRTEENRFGCCERPWTIRAVSSILLHEQNYSEITGLWKFSRRRSG